MLFILLYYYIYKSFRLKISLGPNKNWQNGTKYLKNTFFAISQKQELI